MQSAKSTRDCDHCGEGEATEDLGVIWYCKGCFDEAVDGFAEAYGFNVAEGASDAIG